MLEAILLALSPFIISLLTQAAKWIGRNWKLLTGKWDVRLVAAVLSFIYMSLIGDVNDGIINELAMALIAFLGSQGAFFLSRKS